MYFVRRCLLGNLRTNRTITGCGHQLVHFGMQGLGIHIDKALTAEAVNANIRISDACADTCTLFCADFSGLSALVNLTTLNLSETKIREFPDASRPKSRSCT